MPIYEYRCAQCGSEFDALQKVGAAAPPCEKCGSDEVSKLMSRTSFVLKGGGWYKDGYSSASGGGDKSPKASASESSSSTSTSTPTSTDSSPKAAAKAD